jgi:hypothetical protein
MHDYTEELLSDEECIASSCAWELRGLTGHRSCKLRSRGFTILSNTANMRCGVVCFDTLLMGSQIIGVTDAFNNICVNWCCCGLDRIAWLCGEHSRHRKR